MACCRDCGRRIRWVETRSGHWMPIDPEPNPLGNVVLEQASCSEGRLELVRAYVLKKGQEWPGVRWIHHRATCPKAQEARRRRGVA